MTQLGQYFTTNDYLKEILYSFIHNNPELILEPSIGRGDLISYVKSKNPEIMFDMYEIDFNIEPLENIQKDDVIYCDFLSQNIDKKYKTIIGNPPYIRTKKGNLYIDFIEKCYYLLDDNGELIFIIPSDFFKLTSSKQLLNIMMENGFFTHIYHPHDDKLFKNATIDVIIFRYLKNREHEKMILYNGTLLHIVNNNGMITFEKELDEEYIILGEYFDIYVGLVSGKESIYKNEELGNIDIINGEGKIEKYIYIEEYPSGDQQIDNYLEIHKQELMERKIRKFNENNWFEWGAPRNIKVIKNNIGKKCIYIHNLTRKNKVAFQDKISYFGGGLIMLKPKIACNLKKITLYLNSDTFKNNFTFSKRFKIGHRQLYNSRVPIKYIND